jgi:hypothetical protein
MIAVRHRAAAVVSTVLAISAATMALPAAASAAVPGIDLQFLNVPGEFTPGAAARDITAIVAANAQAGPQCRKVRWQLVVRVQGIDPGQARVERVPEDGGSPLQVVRQGDTTRITDVRFDPKSLCPGAAGRVRAPYRVSIDGERTGRITLESRALDAAGRVLQAASVTSKILKAQERRKGQPGQATKAPAANKTSAPAATPSPIAPAGAGAQDSAAPAAPPAGNIPATRTSSSSGIPSLLGPGLIVGAVLVLAGLILLLRIRLRNRRSDRAMARRQMYQQQVYQQQIQEQQRYAQQMYDEQMYDEQMYDQDGYEPTEPYGQGSRITYSGR